MVNSKSALYISEVNTDHLAKIRSDRSLRCMIAAWIDASVIKAMMFPEGLIYAIARRGHLYLAQRDEVIVGAAFLKYASQTLCGEPVGPGRCALLYGCGSEEEFGFMKLYFHVRAAVLKREVTDLYLGKRLSRNQIKRDYIVRTDAIVHDFVVQPRVLKLGPSPIEMGFYK
jgi:hypothetical protein